MRSHVSNHAVIRYVERVLGHPVDEWLAGTGKLRSDNRAIIVCNRAGLPIDAVRELILCGPVLVAVQSGLGQVIVRYNGFAYVVRSGIVATILTERMRDEKIGTFEKMKEKSRAEIRREMYRAGRRYKTKNKMRHRRRLEEVE